MCEPALIVLRKVAVAKPSATAALCDDLMRFQSATALTLQAPEVSMTNGSLSNSKVAKPNSASCFSWSLILACSGKSAATRGSSAEPAAKAALESTWVMLKSIAVRSKSALMPWIKIYTRYQLDVSQLPCITQEVHDQHPCWQFYIPNTLRPSPRCGHQSCRNSPCYIGASRGLCLFQSVCLSENQC